MSNIFDRIFGDTKKEREEMIEFLSDNPDLLNLFSASFKLGAWFGFRCKVSGLSFKEIAEGLEKAMPTIDVEEWKKAKNRMK